MQKRYAAYYDASVVDDTVLDPELATEFKDGLMAKEDKAKLDKIITHEDGTIGSEVHADDVICDDDNRFVSEEQISNWDSKADATLACDTASGLMPREDKIKLDTVEEGANNYVHPDSHSASIIEQDENHRFVSDEQISKWNNNSSNIKYDPDMEAIIIG